jgi:hypothetical protein
MKVHFEVAHQASDRSEPMPHLSVNAIMNIDLQDSRNRNRWHGTVRSSSLATRILTPNRQESLLPAGRVDE